MRIIAEGISLSSWELAGTNNGEPETREKIFIPAVDSLATRACSQPIGDDNWRPRSLSRTRGRPSLSIDGMKNATGARKDEPRVALSSESTSREYPKGLQVFAQLAYESRNRERHSSSFGPSPSTFLAFDRRSGTLPVSFDLKSRDCRDINPHLYFAS